MILLGPFQLRTLYDSMIYFTNYAMFLAALVCTFTYMLEALLVVRTGTKILRGL